MMVTGAESSTKDWPFSRLCRWNVGNPNWDSWERNKVRHWEGGVQVGLESACTLGLALANLHRPAQRDLPSIIYERPLALLYSAASLTHLHSDSRTLAPSFLSFLSLGPMSTTPIGGFLTLSGAKGLDLPE